MIPVDHPSRLPDGFHLERGTFRHLALAGMADTLALESRQVRVFGKVYDMPRLVAWYGEASYTYGGQTHAPASMPSWLADLRDAVQKRTGARFNSVLANYYRDGGDSIAWHSDDEDELGSDPTIASVSFGASRVFQIRTRRNRTPGGMASMDALAWAVELHHGDLLVMSGPSQSGYQHALPKRRAPGGTRLNLTFRWIHV